MESKKSVVHLEPVLMKRKRMSGHSFNGDFKMDVVPGKMEKHTTSEEKEQVVENDDKRRILLDKLERKCRARRYKLFQNQREKIQEFDKLWEKKENDLENDYKLELSIIRAIYGEGTTKMDNKLKILVGEYEEKKKEHNILKDMELENLKAEQKAARDDERRKAADWKASLSGKSGADPRPESLGSHSEEINHVSDPQNDLGVACSEKSVLTRVEQPNQQKDSCPEKVTHDLHACRDGVPGNIGAFELNKVLPAETESVLENVLTGVEQLNQQKGSCPQNFSCDPHTCRDSVPSDIGAFGLNKEVLPAVTESVLEDVVTVLEQHNQQKGSCPQNIACDPHTYRDGVPGDIGTFEVNKEVLPAVTESVLEDVLTGVEQLNQQKSSCPQNIACDPHTCRDGVPGDIGAFEMNKEVLPAVTGSVLENVLTGAEQLNQQSGSCPQNITCDPRTCKDGVTGDVGAFELNKEVLPAVTEMEQLNQQNISCPQKNTCDQHACRDSVPGEIGVFELDKEVPPALPESVTNEVVDFANPLDMSSHNGINHLDAIDLPDASVTLDDEALGLPLVEQVLNRSGQLPPQASEDQTICSLISDVIQNTGEQVVEAQDTSPFEVLNLQHDIEKLQQSHEAMKLQLKLDRQKEIQDILVQINRNYDMKHLEAEAEFINKKNKIVKNQNIVLLNKALAECYRACCGNLRQLKGVQQASPSSSNSMQHQTLQNMVRPLMAMGQQHIVLPLYMDQQQIFRQPMTIAQQPVFRHPNILAMQQQRLSLDPTRQYIPITQTTHRAAATFISTSQPLLPSTANPHPQPCPASFMPTSTSPSTFQNFQSSSYQPFQRLMSRLPVPRPQLQ